MTVQMVVSEFEIPPMREILVLGKRSPFGPEAAQRMAEAIAPEQYEVVRVQHAMIEALVIRKKLYKMLDKAKLIDIVLAEVGPIAAENSILRVDMKVVLTISKMITD
ncbi:MAG: hypothetical protein HPY81_04870 [Firmicutes bacterium]|nr:hypothetical protein [Bacillota bacterium]